MKSHLKTLFCSLTVILICMLGCSDRASSGQTVFKVERNTTPAESTFPGPPLNITPEARQQLAQATSLREIFKPTWFVKFENHEQGTVARIEDVVFNGKYWFLLDGMQQKVFQFTDQGKFVRQVGATGHGPGEYQEPIAIHAIYDSKIAISDSGKLLVFDAEGRYETSVKLTGEGIWYLPYFEVIWDFPNQIYLADFVSSPFDLTSPLHIILENHGGQWLPVYGFGNRFKLMEEANKHGIPIWAHKAFEKVGDRIWSGSPYNAELEVFDLEGRLVGQAKRPIVDPLTKDDFLDLSLTTEKIHLLQKSKTHNENIFAVGDMVLTFATGHWQSGKSTFHVFDKNGNLLTNQIEEKFPFTFIIGSFEHYVVSQFPVFENVEDYYEKLTPEELDLLMASGWDPNDYLTDNPYLVVGELLPYKKAGQP